MTSRIQPDSRAVLIVATVITSLLAAVSFILSFNGLAEAAAWANVPQWLAWALPAYVDGAILVYTLAALVFRSRGDSARLEWSALGLFAALSVAANGVHAWTSAPEGFRVALGVTLAALAPVSVLLTTHTIAKLIVAPPDAEGMPSRHTPDPFNYERMATEADAVSSPGPSADAQGPTSPARLELAAPVKLLTTTDRNARIHALDAEGDSLRTIAAKVGCSKSTVARVLGKRPDADDERDADAA